MQIVESIEEAVRRSAEDEDICWAVTPNNRLDIFKICYYQAKYRAKKEFKCIYYQKSKDLLYYWLRLVSWLSFGHYKVIYDQR